MKITITASAVMLCLVTMSCSVLLWTSVPAHHLGKAVAAFTATGLEVCKFSFFPAGLVIFARSRLGELLYGFSVLFCWQSPLLPPSAFLKTLTASKANHSNNKALPGKQNDSSSKAWSSR